MDLTVRDYEGKNLRLTLPQLHGQVKRDKSYFTAKGNYLKVWLAKDRSGQWMSLKAEKKFDPLKNMDKKEDPQKGLFDMMKRMYQEGDDDMKRTISEAWTKAASQKQP